MPLVSIIHRLGNADVPNHSLRDQTDPSLSRSLGQLIWFPKFCLIYKAFFLLLLIKCLLIDNIGKNIVLKCLEKMTSKAWSRYSGAYLKQLPIADDRNLVNSVF